MQKNINMTQGKPMKLLFSFALPLMFGNIFQQLYNVTDTAIVGRGVGMHALAALGSSDWLCWLLLGIAFGYSQGFSVRIAQKFGEQNWAELKKYVAQSALLAGAISLVCLVIGQAGMDFFLFMLRVPAELRPMAELYTRIIFGGIVATMFYNYCAATLRAIGNSKTPLIAMIVASVTNIILDLVAVYVLHWGIGGAAAATVLAQFIAGVICCIKMCRTQELKFSKNDLKIDLDILKNLLFLGTPVAAKNLVICIGGMMITAIVNGFSVSFISGFTAANKLFGLLEIAAVSYGYAVTTYVGQNYGAQKIDRIKAGIVDAVKLSIGTSLVIGAIVIALGRFIVRLFISSEDITMMLEAENIGYSFLFVMAVFLPFLYLLYVYLSALQGMGDSVTPMISGFIELGIRVGVSLVVGYLGIQKGIFGAEVGAWVGASVFLIFQYRKFMKRALPDATRNAT